MWCSSWWKDSKHCCDKWRASETPKEQKCIYPFFLYAKFLHFAILTIRDKNGQCEAANLNNERSLPVVSNNASPKTQAVLKSTAIFLQALINIFCLSCFHQTSLFLLTDKSYSCAHCSTQTLVRKGWRVNPQLQALIPALLPKQRDLPCQFVWEKVSFRNWQCPLKLLKIENLSGRPEPAVKHSKLWVSCLFVTFWHQIFSVCWNMSYCITEIFSIGWMRVFPLLFYSCGAVFQSRGSCEERQHLEG